MARSGFSVRLRHRVTISRPETVRDDIGAVETTWLPVAVDLPAEVAPLSGREYAAAQAAQAETHVRITIRAGVEVDPAMRVEHDGRFYNVKAVLPDLTARRRVTLLCDEGVNDG